jgi:signal transduction histidine kinase
LGEQNVRNQKNQRREAIGTDMNRSRPLAPNDAVEAMSLALHAVEQARAAYDPHLVVKALCNAAALSELSGDLVRAYALMLEAESLAIEHGFQLELAHANLALGRCLVAAGHFDRALPRLGTGLKTFRMLGAHDGEVNALQELAGFHKAQGEYESMFVYLEESLQTFASEESAEKRDLLCVSVAEGHAHHAAALIAQGHLFEASAECDRALGLLPPRCQAGAPEVANCVDARLSDTMARLHLLQGDVAASAACAMAMLLGGRKRRTLRLVACACDRFADIRMAQGSYAKAVWWLKRSRATWERLNMHREQVVALERLSDAFAALDQHAEALQQFKAARRIDEGARSMQAGLRAELMLIELNAERDLRRGREALEHTSRLAALGRMVASIAHEVTQPLSAIRLVAETAMPAAADDGSAQPGAARAQRGFTQIVKLVDQLTVYVEHLKRFTRPGAVELQPTLLSRIVGDALAIVESKRKSFHLKLKVDIVDAPVLVDPGRTSAVLVNLLCNAFDAVQAAGQREVELTAHQADGRGWLRVRDHGHGLSPKTLSRLFQPFYTTKAPGKGSGLGLALSMDIARQMGARLAGGNHPEGGALFTLDMPLAPLAAPLVPPMPPMPPVPKVAEATALAPPAVVPGESRVASLLSNF